MTTEEKGNYSYKPGTIIHGICSVLSMIVTLLNILKLNDRQDKSILDMFDNLLIKSDLLENISPDIHLYCRCDDHTIDDCEYLFQFPF